MHPRNLATAACAAGLALLAQAALNPALSATLNRWVQYGPNDTVFVRSISDAGTAACPPLSIDGHVTPMNPRFAPTAAYPILMCEVQLPLGSYGAKVATLDGVALKMPVRTPRRIVVIGDTGCRVNGGTVPQDCNNYASPMDFPLASLGAYVATFNPDLIVHTGDFYYREKDAACSAANASLCGGVPGGQNVGQTWNVWNADWFAPAATMMQSAPMAITRGNHESCNRGAVGWFHLLAVQTYASSADLEYAASCGVADGFAAGAYQKVSAATPDPMPRDPNDTTAPYVVKAGPTALIMFDISYANDTVYQPALAAFYKTQLAGVMPGTVYAGHQATFFVAHKPIYGINGGTATFTGASPYVAGGNVNEQQVFQSAGESGLNLFLSGHTHNFQVVDVNGFVPQLVIGNSGTQLDGQQVPLGANLKNATYKIANGAVNASTDAVASNSYTSAALDAINDFGFAVLDLVTDAHGTAIGYVANIHNLHANLAGRCVIVFNPRSMACSS